MKPLSPYEIDHRTIGSGDREPQVFKVRVIPSVFADISSGERATVQVSIRVCKEAEIGDYLLIRNWVLIDDWRYTGATTGHECKVLIVSELPSRRSDFRHFIIRLVNEKSLYEQLRAFLSRAYSRLVLFCRGR